MHRFTWKTALYCLLAAGSTAYVVLHVHNTVLAASTPAAEPAVGPAYAPDGSLLPPTHYREWIYLSTGIDMSYSTKSAADHSMFDNVFVNPASYRNFLQTGTWPDKTMLVLEVREARSKGSINQRGHYQGTDIMGLEVHVKDKTRFPGEWAFFDFDSPTSKGTLIPSGAPCYSCHAAHGAVNTTFVQFYPTLLPIAGQKGTLSEAYRKEAAAEGSAQ